MDASEEPAWVLATTTPDRSRATLIKGAAMAHTTRFPVAVLLLAAGFDAIIRRRRAG
jgi:hypothetical protein